MALWIHDEGTTQGARARQEDNFGVFELPPEVGAGDLLLILADGMGGELGGARASTLAINTFVEHYDAVSARSIPERLERTLFRVNENMAQEVVTDLEQLQGMGCTLLAAVFTDAGLYWISVGDSPLWLWRRGRLHRLNEDHAYRKVLARQVELGEISIEEAARHPDRNTLISAVTGGDLELVDVSREIYPLERGDQVLLASDGLLTLSEMEIAAVLEKTRSNELPCQKLLTEVAARKRPYQDNTTVLWIRRSDGERFGQLLWRRLWQSPGRAGHENRM
ncbi:MAG: serine/threonine protein phosphatase [Candidatus Contendobacter odensis]|uniref:Serine/threonine protein phosphatase n=1 Tax=Candidatus Contendibacter odensensis TaxID=1400860 RepID=A0A2G6PGF3_9GAMM|nr:MAG: serine/threonine protein phosphatase [Candidatus Contendobacter odensis]